MDHQIEKTMHYKLLFPLVLSLNTMPLIGGCILRNVINHSETADIVIRGIEPVKGTTGLKHKSLGARVPPKPRRGKATKVIFNQPTGNRLKVEVEERSELGHTCKRYLLKVDEMNNEVNLLKRESCAPHFGYDIWTPAELLPVQCYVDLVLGSDVNSLQLKVVPADELKAMALEKKNEALEKKATAKK